MEGWKIKKHKDLVEQLEKAKANATSAGVAHKAEADGKVKMLKAELAKAQLVTAQTLVHMGGLEANMAGGPIINIDENAVPVLALGHPGSQAQQLQGPKGQLRIDGPAPTWTVACRK